MHEELELRVHWRNASPTLVYLPGLHGDWTLIGGFRESLRQRACFVETTYPRTLDWSLDDYAAAMEEALARNGISQGWILAESFGSQVAWAMASRKRFNAQGIILAGGFAQYPVRPALRFAERIAGEIPLSLLVRILFGYSKIARFRFRHNPQTLAVIDTFIARRTEKDRRAAVHRLHLIGKNDPRGIVQRLELPLYALSGWLDPIVPWFFVRGWLRSNCGALKDYKIIRSADHNVLSTAPQTSADHVLRWVSKG
jgi:pimeloyl-ACP methyl ester carboxylesterase